MTRAVKRIAARSGGRQRVAAQGCGLRAMRDLVTASSARGSRGSSVGRRQALHVAVQVRLDLPFGLGDESQAGAVAQGARQRRRSRRSPRTTAGSAGWCARPVRASRCSHQARWSISSAAAWRIASATRRVARRQGLALVKRLGRDLARMVDPHQPRRFAALGLVQRELARRRRAGDGPRRCVRVRIRP